MVGGKSTAAVPAKTFPPPLAAPAVYVLPAALDTRHLVDFLSQVDKGAAQEIFALSSKSVLYELAVSFVERYAEESPLPVVRCCQIVKGFDFFASRLYGMFELEGLLLECKCLLLRAIESKTGVVEFEASLKDTFSVSSSRFKLTGEGDPRPGGEVGFRIAQVETACYAEEVDAEVYRFHDVDKTERQDIVRRIEDQEKAGAPPKPSTRLVWFDYVDARTAYSVAMFMWVTIHLLLRRLSLIGGYWEENAGDPSAKPLSSQLVRQLTTVLDGFEMALNQAQRRKVTGDRHYGRREWRAAIQEYSKAIELSPPGDEGRYMYYSHRAGCFLQVGEHARALEDCNLSLNYNTRYFPTLYRRAQAYEQLGKKASALADLERLLQLHPDHMPAQDYRARLLQKTAARDPGPELVVLPLEAEQAPPPAEAQDVEVAVDKEAEAGAEEEGEGPDDTVDRKTHPRGPKRKKKKKPKGAAEEGSGDDDAASVDPPRGEEPEEPQPAKSGRASGAAEAAARREEQRRLKEERQRKEQQARAERERREKRQREEQERQERREREEREEREER